MKFVIVSPPYDENNGGSIVLHKLCDIINKSGFDASILPLIDSREINALNWQEAIHSAIISQSNLEFIINHPEHFRLCDRYNTKLFQGAIGQIAHSPETIVVYPEITFGNPLGARHVARWLLHNPGFHTGKVYYSAGEVQFQYSNLFQPLNVPYLEIADFHLSVIDIPWDLYRNDQPQLVKREGTAYLVKKGHGRAAIHDLENSICIDGLGHNDVAAIFKSVETFISYDQASFYSSLASLAGCVSIIAPGMDSATRNGDVTGHGRNGIAYGFEDIQRAIDTVPQMIVELQEQERESVRSVDRFLQFWGSRLCRST